MYSKYTVLFCVVFLFINTHGYTTPAPNPLDSLKRNMEAFKNCIDQSLAGVVGDVNEKQLQPVFNVLGDSLNRFSKAFEDILGPNKSH